MTLYVNNSGTWTQPKAVFINNSGTWTEVKQLNYNNSGNWTTVYSNEVVATLSSSASTVYIPDLFSTTDWSNSYKKKRIIIPSGVEIGSNNWWGGLILNNNKGSWAGSLSIENSGTISGIGGVAANGQGGRGGAAIQIDIRSTTNQNANVYNWGAIRAGGGCGGTGGQGGGGYYTYNYTSYDSGFTFSYYNNCVALYNGTWFWYWGGGNFYAGGEPNQVNSGNSAYYKGDYQGLYGETYMYAIRRVDTSTGYAYTSGGAGGAGGRGQGYDGSAQGGAGGGAPGTNAGWGGSGGWGGGWGAAGATGATGGAGNNGGGSAGSGGAAAGYFLSGYATLYNYNSVQGNANYS